MNFFKKNSYATIDSLNSAIKAVNSSLTAIRSRMASGLGMSHNGRRNIYDVYGYPQEGAIDFNSLYWMSKRMGMANRITHGLAKSCWRNGFKLKSDDNEIFEDEIKILKKRGMLTKLERADILNRIGSFSVLFVGVPDGRPPSEPLGRVSNGLDRVYFKVFAYDGIQVHQLETDESSPRYGLPKLYTVQQIHRGDTEKDLSAKSIIVHYSRIILMNEGALDSDIEGSSSIEPVFNNLLDIQKSTGGASEAYFRNARGKISFEIDKEFAANALLDDSVYKKIQESSQSFTNNWDDQIIAAGSKVSTHSTAHYSPLDTVKTSLWIVSSYTGLPIRILTGEGAGQLAGSEDKLTYNSIVSDRQHLECSPWVINLLEMLSEVGLIAEIPDNMEIDWPKEEAHSEKEQTDINKTKAETVKTLTDAATTPGGDALDVEATLAAWGCDDIIFDSIDDLE